MYVTGIIYCDFYTSIHLDNSLLHTHIFPPTHTEELPRNKTAFCCGALLRPRGDTWAFGCLAHLHVNTDIQTDGKFSKANISPKQK